MWSQIKPLTIREAVVICALGLIAVLLMPEGPHSGQTSAPTVVAAR